MKKLLALAVATATISLAIPATASAAAPTDAAKAPASTAQSSTVGRLAPPNMPPVFTGYLVCFNGWVYSDFADSDGDEKKMLGQLAVWRADRGWTYHNMGNSGGAGHGVFFYIELAQQGINPATVSWYAVRARDDKGAWSGWTYADSTCKVL